MGRVVLDTSVLIALERNLLSFEQVISQGQRIYVPEVAVGELLVGAERSSDQAHREKRLAFLKSVEDFSESVAFDRAHAHNFAKLAAQSHAMGHPRGALDLAIAASAVTLNAVLYTRDAKGKFDQLIGLTVKEF